MGWDGMGIAWDWDEDAMGIPWGGNGMGWGYCGVTIGMGRRMQWGYCGVGMGWEWVYSGGGMGWGCHRDTVGLGWDGMWRTPVGGSLHGVSPPNRVSHHPPPHRVDGKDASYESRLEHKRDLCRNGIVGHLRGGQEPPHKVRTPPSAPPRAPRGC